MLATQNKIDQLTQYGRAVHGNACGFDIKSLERKKTAAANSFITRRDLEDMDGKPQFAENPDLNAQ